MEQDANSKQAINQQVSDQKTSERPSVDEHEEAKGNVGTGAKQSKAQNYADFFKQMGDKVHNAVHQEVGDDNVIGSVTGVDQRGVHYHFYSPIQAVSEFQATAKPTPTEKTYVLSDPGEFAAFLNEQMIGQPFRSACILALFDTVTIADLAWLSNELEKQLPQVFDDDESIVRLRAEFHMSQDRVLAMIKAEFGKVTIDDPAYGHIAVESVRFSEETSSELVLQNLWRQFPHMRPFLIQWLFDILQQNERPLRREVLGVFVKILKNDMPDGDRAIVAPMMREQRYFYMLAMLFQMLLRENSMEQYTNKRIRDCMLAEHAWLWKIPLLLYSWDANGIYCDAILSFLREIMQQYLSPEGEDHAVSFLGRLLVHSKRLRNDVCALVGELYAKATLHGRDSVAMLLLQLIFSSLMRLRDTNYYLPLVVYDTQRQYESLQSLYMFIIKKANAWQSLRYLLVQYLVKYDEQIAGDPKLTFFFDRLVKSDSIADREGLVNRLCALLRCNALSRNRAATIVSMKLSERYHMDLT